MTNLRYNRVTASIDTLQRIEATAVPMMMVWPHEAGTAADPTLVDHPTAAKLCEAYRQQGPDVQAKMEHMIASRRATFESLYRQLFGAVNHAPESDIGDHLSTDVTLIDALVAYRAKPIPVEEEVSSSDQPGRLSRLASALGQTLRQTTARIGAMSW
ncbi:hypothetical protein [Halomonas sp. I5-271120]|uniref:hypothetical protein n=1 Tax=Halomonas sp. I5-271120 TaxID=3061632 RepID=UPI002715014E|nr:hypothetical protein [Halomonas sp. I5-271120]